MNFINYLEKLDRLLGKFLKFLFCCISIQHFWYFNEVMKLYTWNVFEIYLLVNDNMVSKWNMFFSSVKT